VADKQPFKEWQELAFSIEETINAYVAERVREAVREGRVAAFEQCRKLLVAQGSDTCLAGSRVIEMWRDGVRAAAEAPEEKK
jgi:hypothetical protein